MKKSRYEILQCFSTPSYFTGVDMLRSAAEIRQAMGQERGSTQDKLED